MCRNLLTLLLLLPLCGCSTLGLSLFPSGSFLTKQAEQVLECSPASANLPRELNRTVLPVHYLEPGDVLLIEPTDFDSDIRLPVDQRVMADGSLDLGRFGRVVVAGLTLEDAENLIEHSIQNQLKAPEFDEKKKTVEINIRLLEPVHRYYVLGEVHSPGSYPLSGFETVLDGILAAGGLTNNAAPCKVLLARPTTPCECRVTLPICYREIVQLGDTTTNYQLQPGDRIFVSTRSCMDELLFWKANETCDRCCKCQHPYTYPQSVTTMVPVTPGMLGLANIDPMIEQSNLGPAAIFPPSAPLLESGAFDKVPSSASDVLNGDRVDSPLDGRRDGQLDFTAPMP